VTDNVGGHWPVRDLHDERAWLHGEETIRVEAVSDESYDYILVTRLTRSPAGDPDEQSAVLLDHEQAAWLRNALTDLLREHSTEDCQLRVLPSPAGPANEPGELNLFDD